MSLSGMFLVCVLVENVCNYQFWIFIYERGVISNEPFDVEKTK